MEDFEIVELFWSRDEKAITETERKYGKMCKNLAFHILPSMEDAEECLNDALQALWNSIPPKKPEHFKAYLLRITRNLAVNMITRAHAWKRSPEMQRLFPELTEMLPTGPSIEQELEKKELSHLINAWLQDLPRQERTLFIRRYYLGISLKELADTSKIPPEKLAQIMFRLRKQLKKELEKEGVMV